MPALKDYKNIGTVPVLLDFSICCSSMGETLTHKQTEPITK